MIINLDNHCSYIGIQNVSLIKYLGVVVDEKFKWSYHIQKTTVFSSKPILGFKNLSPLLLRTVYFSFA